MAKTDNVKVWGQHNHGPNFGRYVAGCSYCEKKLARGGFNKHERARVAEQKVVHEIQQANIGFTPAQLQQIMALMEAKNDTESTKEAFIAAIRELKAPDPEAAAKAQAEKERREKELARRVENARIEMEMRKQMQEQCPHQKENGKTAINQGQPFSDGYYHPFCQHCGKQFALRKVEMSAVI